MEETNTATFTAPIKTAKNVRNSWKLQVIRTKRMARLGQYGKSMIRRALNGSDMGKTENPPHFFLTFPNHNRRRKAVSDSFLLHEADRLQDAHLPVIVFFSVISDKSRFVRIIDQLSNGIGYGFEFAVCTFPDDIEAESEKFGDGVEFSLHSGESVVISYQEFYYYLKKACMNYLKKYPEKKDVVNEIFEKVRKRYNITQ